jgi:hypothetical protein
MWLIFSSIKVSIIELEQVLLEPLMKLVFQHHLLHFNDFSIAQIIVKVVWGCSQIAQ